MVAAGEGVALIPKIAERTGTQGCVPLLVIDKGLHYNLCAVYDENFPSALRDTFLGIVEEEARRVESEVAPKEGSQKNAPGPEVTWGARCCLNLEVRSTA
ncbi:MAG: LysR family transcriptional regulator [Prosthecobacter sp.]|nr:LysR family transcriptional regulator [Prosthecobacter sp.]